MIHQKHYFLRTLSNLYVSRVYVAPSNGPNTPIKDP